MKRILILCGLFIILVSCSTLQPERNIASSQQDCISIINNFFKPSNKELPKSFFVSIENKRVILQTKVQVAYKKYIEEIYDKSTPKQRALIEHALKSIEGDSEVEKNLNLGDLGYFNPRTFQVGMASNWIGTEVGAIIMSHELQHLRDASGKSGSKMDRWLYLTKSHVTKDLVFKEESSAFKVQRRFILAAHNQNDLETLKELELALHVIRKIAQEEALARIENRNIEQVVHLAKEDEPIVNSITAMAIEELEHFSKILDETLKYYTVYRKLVEGALTSEENEYINKALVAYQQHNKELNKKMTIRLIALGSGGASSGIYYWTNHKKSSNSEAND